MSAAAPVLPPEVLQFLAQAFMQVNAPEESAPAPDLNDAGGLAKALPFVVLSWVNGMQSSGQLSEIVAREGALLATAGVPEADRPAALCVAFGVLLAKMLQDVLVIEAAKQRNG